MRRAVTSIWLTSLVILAVGAPELKSAEQTNASYSTIPDHNSFRLRSPTNAPVLSRAPAPGPVTQLKLAGITTVLGKKQAFLRAQTTGRPGQAPNEETYILTEGQSAGNLEVVQIDEDAGRVVVRNAGGLTTLNLEENAPTLPTNPPAAIASAPTAASPGPALPPTGAGPYSSIYNNSTNRPVTSAGLPEAPLVTNNTQVVIPPPLPPVVITDSTLTAEENQILDEIQREIANTNIPPGIVPPPINTNLVLPPTGSGRSMLPPTREGGLPPPGSGSSMLQPGAGQNLPATGPPER